MTRCAAVKKKGSTIQCPATTLKGHTLCGTHARSKNVELWIDTNQKDGRIVKCQSVARRWLVLHHLRLAGPGVLCRKNLANDEELVSCEDASKQSPFEYFSFEENGRVYWFDFSSIWTWSLKTLGPTNPYTRTPIGIDVRKRLREMWLLRTLRKLPIPPEPTETDERMRGRWTMICQIFADNGFVDVTVGEMMRLGKSSHITMWRFLQEDSVCGPRACAYMLSSHLVNSNAPTYIVNSLRLLMRILTIQKEPYLRVFNVMSAIYRC